MGLDRLSRVALLAVGAALLSACDKDDGGRPERLLYGEAAQELTPVPNSVVTIGRALDGTTLGRRFASCRLRTFPTTRRWSSESVSSARA
jgi:hypothetical protein